jgi:transposase
MRAIGRAIGLDVHLEFCEVAIAQDGVVRSTGRIETTPERLELFGASLHPQDRVALEVTGNAWEIARILESHVAKVIVVSPADTGIRQARAKTDRLDARTLARLLAAGELDAEAAPAPSASLPSTAGRTTSASTRPAGCCGRSSRSTATRSPGPT